MTAIIQNSTTQQGFNMDKWISINDRLPLDLNTESKYRTIQVIVKYMEDYEGENSNGVGVASYTVGQSPLPWGSWSNEFGNIIEWMHLPK